MRKHLVHALLAIAVSMPATMAVTVGTGIAFAPQANAAIDCISGYNGLFDGYFSQNNAPSGWPYEGASATMVNNSAPICDTGSQDPNFNFSLDRKSTRLNSS